jgi:hypothetical protein
MPRVHRAAWREKDRYGSVRSMSLSQKAGFIRESRALLQQAGDGIAASSI